jgi:hypothetical protein
MQRQERAFGLLRKVYVKRAMLRGEQSPVPNDPAGTTREATDST